jgi:hypothetical protein
MHCSLQRRFLGLCDFVVIDHNTIILSVINISVVLLDPSTALARKVVWPDNNFLIWFIIIIFLLGISFLLIGGNGHGLEPGLNLNQSGLDNRQVEWWGLIICTNGIQEIRRRTVVELSRNVVNDDIVMGHYT